MTGLEQFELILGVLAVTLALSSVAPYLRLPPAATLTLGGMAVAMIPWIPVVELNPDLVLVLFLPPLLQASAFGTSWRDFRAALRPILLMAVGAVAFTTAAVAGAAKLMLPDLPWAACVALGAIVSPPDAVAAKAVLQRLPLPRKLVTVLEGESLLNDASGLVLYRFAVAAAMSGSVSVGQAAGSFAWVALGGVLVGVLFAAAINLILSRVRDANLSISLSFMVAWASYLAAEHVHASGVLAVVATGLGMGSAAHRTLTADTRRKAFATWTVVVFLLEALVFVLIGLSLRGVVARLGWEGMALGLPLALVVSGVVVVSRFAWVFPTAYLPLLLPKRRRGDVPPLPAVALLSWAGMRGVVSLAAALALPEGFPGRDAIVLATFGVIGVTVLIQGGTLGPLARGLHIERVMEAGTSLSQVEARAEATAASAAWLAEQLDPASGSLLHPRLLEEYERRTRASRRLVEDPESLRAIRHDHFMAALGAVAAGRSALHRLHAEQRIHDSVLHTIEAELDLEELRLQALATGGTSAH